MLSVTRGLQTHLGSRIRSHTRRTDTTVDDATVSRERLAGRYMQTDRLPSDVSLAWRHSEAVCQGRALAIRFGSQSHRSGSMARGSWRESVRSAQTGLCETGNRPPEPHSGARSGSKNAGHRDTSLDVAGPVRSICPARRAALARLGSWTSRPHPPARRGQLDSLGSVHESPIGHFPRRNRMSALSPDGLRGASSTAHIGTAHF